MRLNQFIALNSTLSRRKADELIKEGKVLVNGKIATLGTSVSGKDTVELSGKELSNSTKIQTILFNKPVGYICSRDGQGGRTIYDILPKKYHSLNPVGRLDKDSSGLLIMTNDGKLAEKLSHPRYKKEKVYLVTLNKELLKEDQDKISTNGVILDDGLSKLKTEKTKQKKTYKVTLTEGRNRQIRRTFDALNYEVTSLHRTRIENFLCPTEPQRYDVV